MPYPSYGTDRGSGLCYLYADSNNSTLRYFSDVTDSEGNAMECLGQGGNDPLSHTMAAVSDHFDNDSVEWAFWNE